MKYNIILIGNGKWGQNYIKTISNIYNINLIIANRNNWKELIDNGTDGVIIATPPNSHIEIAKYSLEKNIPTMIEKPISLSLNDALCLKQFSAPILVNYIHLFSNSYQDIKEKSDSINRIYTLGFNKGPIRDYSSLLDYGCHDLAMILDLSNDFPYKIRAKEIITDNGLLFRIKLDFNKFASYSLVGNGGCKPIRKLKIDCNNLKLEYDDKFRPSNYIPPLTNAINVFIGAISGKKDYRLGLDLSFNILEILENCNNLIKLSI